jgi:redox-sensitive bicupin YhaK (pirin superfamily)
MITLSSADPPGPARFSRPAIYDAVMTGPVTPEDLVAASLPDPAVPIELTTSRTAMVGQSSVRRALPNRSRRTIGAWCFVDHMGPAEVTDPATSGIGPHPHMGLQTVTWLLSGELRHRDSLGSDQVIRPGQLNLMTAGYGVAHAEEGNDYRGSFQGVQLWVAQPEATRHDSPAFEHHDELPVVELGHATGTVLVGAFGSGRSPARRDTDHFGVDLAVGSGSTELPLSPKAEHALVMLEGAVSAEDTVVTSGHLFYIGPGRSALGLAATGAARGLLLGGVPFESPVSMWWNFVARTHDEIDAATRDWNAESPRFGEVESTLGRIPAPDTPWR